MQGLILVAVAPMGHQPAVIPGLSCRDKGLLGSEHWQ